MYVIQNYKGISPSQTPRKKLDDYHSTIWTSSTFLYSNRRDLSTDDKLVLGYTYDGLPFQIVVNGMFGCDRYITFEFIDVSVTTLIDQYSRDLSDVTKNADQVTTNFIQTLRSLRRPPDVEFTMSIAVTYERAGQLQCSGFGIGDTAIALRRSTGEIEQLVTHNQANNFRDGFNNFCAPLTTSELLTRNTIFTTPITADDELVGYTWMQEGLEETKKSYEVLDTRLGQIPVKKIGLKLSTLEDETLYNYLVKENSRIQNERIAAKQNGGDTTLGQIIVPTPELRNKLKNAPLFELEANIELINNPALKIKATAVYTAAQKLIRQGEKVDSIIQNVILTNKLLTSVPGVNRDYLVAEYICAAKQANGKASMGGQALGIAMLALGLAVATCGILICIGTLGLGSSVGATTTVIGGGISAAGLGIFSKNKQSGLSKAMVDCALASPGRVF